MTVWGEFTQVVHHANEDYSSFLLTGCGILVIACTLSELGSDISGISFINEIHLCLLKVQFVIVQLNVFSMSWFSDTGLPCT